MVSEAHAKRVKDKYRHDLRKIKNVTGFGVFADPETGEPIIMIHLKPGSALPTTSDYLDGVPVRYGHQEALGPVWGIEDRDNLWRPAPIGCQIGNYPSDGDYAYYGTLGNVLRKNGETFVISNRHILQHIIGSDAYQPLEWDTNNRIATFIGSPAFVPYPGENLVDLGWARVDNPSDVIDEVLGLEMSNTYRLLEDSVTEVNIGDHVVKSGQTTGTTHGFVSSSSYDTVQPYPFGQGDLLFTDTIIVNPRDWFFVYGGDSGSGCWADDGRFIGLLFAAYGGGVGVICKTKYIVQYMGNGYSYRCVMPGLIDKIVPPPNDTYVHTDITVSQTSGPAPLSVHVDINNSYSSYGIYYGDGLDPQIISDTNFVYKNDGLYCLNVWTYRNDNPDAPGADQSGKDVYITVGEGTQGIRYVFQPSQPVSPPWDWNNIPIEWEITFWDMTTAGNARDFDWDFGDGQHSTERSAKHKYTSPGIYYPSLTATLDGKGRYTKISNQGITIIGGGSQVMADFTANPSSGKAPLTVQFTNNSQNAVSYDWDFRDGVTTHDANPQHTFGIGVWDIILVAHGSDGSTNQKTIPVTVTEDEPPTPINWTTLALIGGGIVFLGIMTSNKD